MSELSPADRAVTGADLVLRRVLVLLWLVSAPVLCLLYLKVEPSPDQAQFDYMGWMATMGQPFYAGSFDMNWPCLLYTSPSPRDRTRSRMPSSA